MKKIVLLLCAVLVVFPLVMTGCGVSEDEYAAVVAQRDAAQAQAASLQAEKDALQADNDTLQAEKDALEAEKSEATSLFAGLKKKLAAAAMIDDYASAYADSTMSESDYEEIFNDFMSGFGGALDDIGNAELSELWDNCLAASAQNDDEAFGSNLAAIMVLLAELIDDDIAAIEAALE